MRKNQKQYYKQLRQNRLDNGLCGRCGKNPIVTGLVVCETCQFKKRANRDRQISNGKCQDCGVASLATKTRCINCKIKVDQGWKKRKAIVYNAYGGFNCSCCGETEEAFLSIDHINNDGAEQRRNGQRGASIYPWLIKHGFPSGYQILCHNCQWGKRTYGICPHQQQKIQAEAFIYPF